MPRLSIPGCSHPSNRPALPAQTGSTAEREGYSEASSLNFRISMAISARFEADKTTGASLPGAGCNLLQLGVARWGFKLNLNNSALSDLTKPSGNFTSIRGVGRPLTAPGAGIRARFASERPPVSAGPVVPGLPVVSVLKQTKSCKCLGGFLSLPDLRTPEFPGIGAGDPGPLTGELLLCLLYTSPSPRDQRGSRMPSSA